MSLSTAAKTSSNSDRYTKTVILALTAPPLLLIELWQSSSERYKHWIITLLFTIFGSVMIIGVGDGYRHQLMVDYYYTSLGFDQFLEDLWKILTLQITESGARDVYKHVLSYVIGGLLGLPQLFFVAVATVYGYFFAGSVLHVLRHFKWKHSNYVVLGFVFIFLFIKGLDGFYTVRTGTGMWVLVYACLKYYEERRPRYLLLMFAPPLIHFGYFLMAIPAWVVLAFGSRPMIYSVILVMSTFSNFLPTQVMTDPISRTEIGAAKLQGYTVSEQDDSMEEFQRLASQTNLYNAYRKSGLHRWAPAMLAFALIFSGVYLRGMSQYHSRILSVGIVTLAFSNLTWFLFAVHNRTLTIAIIFILAGYLMARLHPTTARSFRGLPPQYQLGLHLSLLLFVPLMMFTVSFLLDRMSIMFLGMPFLAWFYPDLQMSVKEGLNYLLGRG